MGAVSGGWGGFSQKCSFRPLLHDIRPAGDPKELKKCQNFKSFAHFIKLFVTLIYEEMPKKRQFLKRISGGFFGGLFSWPPCPAEKASKRKHFSKNPPETLFKKKRSERVSESLESVTTAQVSHKSVSEKFNKLCLTTKNVKKVNGR